MLKTAYEKGLKLAFDELGLTPEQMLAAQRITGVGGGVAGAGLGGLLGHYLGGRTAEAFDLDPTIAKALGAGVGALGGGALGGFVGSQIPQWKYQRKHEEPKEESALGVLPVAYGTDPYLGYDYGYGDEPMYGLSDYGYY
jgi:hypothetical protein